MSVEIKGMDKVVDELNKRIKKVGDYNQKTLEMVALDLKGKSVELAPIDTGDLRGSGYAEIGKHEATVGFNEPYALRQHEELDYSHPKGGQAKYLEQPLKENTDNYIKAFEDSVKRGVE